jgi:hypothetical protein
MAFQLVAMTSVRTLAYLFIPTNTSTMLLATAAIVNAIAVNAANRRLLTNGLGLTRNFNSKKTYLVCSLWVTP